VQQGLPRPLTRGYYSGTVEAAYHKGDCLMSDVLFGEWEALTSQISRFKARIALIRDAAFIPPLKQGAFCRSNR